MKVIGLIRTSTARQEVESQKAEIINMIKADGYSDNDIVIVGNAGASAIKLDEEYQNNINEVYNLIEKGDIKCVYAWGIDRIGRNEEVLMQFKNRLIKNGVNLKIKNPTLSLLDADGQVNQGVELAFSLFSTMAKQEMETKKARFKRAKERNKREGKFNGGKIMFGYTVKEDGTFDVYEPEAKVVRDIFTDYAYSTKSSAKIAQEYMELGFIKQYKQKTSADHFILEVLKNEAYIGCHEYKYPRLITDEVWEAVQQKLKDYRVLPKVRYTKTVYYCQGLVKEMSITFFPMYPMRVKKSEASYVSKSEKFSISINNLDSMVIQVMDDVIKKYDKDAAQKEVDTQKKRLSSRISSLKEKEKNAVEAWEELEERYFLQRTASKSKYEELSSKLQLEVDNLRDEISRAEAELRSLQDVVVEEVDLYSMTDEGRQAMVRKYIGGIFIRKLDKWCSEIYFLFIKGYSGTYGLTYNRRNKTFWNYCGEGGEPVTTPIKIIRNIKGRKRDYSNRNKNGKLLDVQG